MFTFRDTMFADDEPDDENYVCSAPSSSNAHPWDRDQYGKSSPDPEQGDILTNGISTLREDYRRGLIESANFSLETERRRGFIDDEWKLGKQILTIEWVRK